MGKFRAKLLNIFSPTVGAVDARRCARERGTARTPARAPATRRIARRAASTSDSRVTVASSTSQLNARSSQVTLSFLLNIHEHVTLSKTKGNIADFSYF